MSQVKVQGNASGTGIFTIESPNSNTNRTLTLPDATGTVQVSGNPISGTTASFSGDVTLGSSVLATPSGSAPSYLCRAWVNFNGTGTVAIRGSGNVSSITDGGTGDYTVNFTTAMPDANFATEVARSLTTDTDQFIQVVNSQTTTSVRVINSKPGISNYDCAYVAVAVFR